MKSEKVIRAYRGVEPNDEQKDRIFRKALRKSMDSPAKIGRFPMRKQKKTLRLAVVLTITAAMLSTLAVGGYAATKKWSLPDPELKPEGSERSGNYVIHQSTTYGAEALSPEKEPEETEVGKTRDDVWFIREAIRVLESIGIEDLSTEEMTVTRRNALMYDREEANVGFTDTSILTEVTFDAQTGTLLKISSIEQFELAALPAVTSDAEAEACGRGYLEKLPVPQDVKLTYIEKYDECYWTMDFCREVKPGVTNAYEMVRISINPQNGLIQGMIVFNFPLIDDHDGSDAPLTEEQALAIGAKAVFGEMAWEESYTLEKAAVEIVLPNWFYTDRYHADARYARNSRYAWVFRFEEHIRVTGDVQNLCEVWVDLYTGEVLGGDRTF